MCGYARRHISSRQLHELADLFNDAGLVVKRGVEELVHFYPAFGGYASRQLNDLIIVADDCLATVDATWWFDCEEAGEALLVNNKRTTFNARNLSSPYWRGPIRHQRAVLVVTGIGESKLVEGKKRHFLVESEEAILLGCVYRRFSNGCYSAAVITRDSHPRFEPYHGKAFPLMLPPDPEILKVWLSDASEQSPVIMSLLSCSKIYNRLAVTEVKTFKGEEYLSEVKILQADT